MPLLAVFVYLSPIPWWGIGIAIGAVMASTDFVDGMLARKYGPTELGGLLDPIADKVFVALTYLPLVDIDYFPATVVAVMFVREFIVTALRSAYLQRDIHFRTSYLSKVKTWVQMQGMGGLMLAAIVDPTWMTTILLTITAAPLLPVAVVAVTQRRIFRGGIIMIGFMGLLTSLFVFPPRLEITVLLSLCIITGLAWVSGLDYLVGGLPKLYQAGGFHRADVVRLLSALATPVVSVVVLVRLNISPLPVLVVVVAELAVGGLDNLLSRHNVAASALAWSVRTLGSAAILLAAFFMPTTALATIMTCVAMVVSVVGCANEFWRGRRYYL